ncbi:MAG: creatininase family protein [Lachnospiraceae bacterium]|nr:creatininase family protein [Lachnospiraceae bacterium]
MKNNFEILTATMMGMTYEEVENAVKENAVVLFPVGVVEAHGPHKDDELIYYGID